MKYDFLVDSHCHLDSIADNDTGEIVKMANDCGVRVINNICANIDDAEKVMNTTKKYKNVFCSIGHHPEELKNKNITMDDLLKYKDCEKLIGIGESGLDYFSAESVEKSKQIENFFIHIEVARQLGLPLVIHSRECDEDIKNILKTEIRKKEFSFVLHCFCSGKELAKTALDCGGFISFSGILTFKNAISVQETAKIIPLDKILVETDSPYLAPVPHRGKTNQPAFTKFTAEFLAKLLNLDFEQIQNSTTENFFKLFNKANYEK